MIIRYEQLNELCSGICSACNDISARADICAEKADVLIGDPTQFGELAGAVKAYMSQVHRTLLMAISALSSQICELSAAYRKGYEDIDPSTTFVLDTACIYEFSESLTSLLCELREVNDRINRTISGIADIVSCGCISCDGVEYVTMFLHNIVMGIVSDIEKWEDTCRTRTESLKNAVSFIERLMSASISGNFTVGIMPALTGIIGPEIIDGLKMYSFLYDNGFTKEMIAGMKSLGYSADDLRTILRSCSSEEDRLFVITLSAGDYEKAFSADQHFLSLEMDLFMAEYGARVFSLGNVKQFERFNNAILSQTEGTGLFWDLSPGMLTNRHMYIDRMYEGTAALLEINSYSIFQNGSDECSSSKNLDYMSLLSIWNTQYNLEEELSFRIDHEMPLMVKYDKIDHETHEVSYTFLYTEMSHDPFSDRKTVHSIQVDDDMLETADDLVNGIYLRDRSALEDEADSLMLEILAESVTGAAGGLISLAVPGAGLAVRMLEKAIAGKNSSLDNKTADAIRTVTGSDYGADDLLIEQVIDGFQEYRNKSEELSSRMMELDKSYEGSLWGSGIRSSYIVPGTILSGDRISVLSGIYNPEYLDTLGRWSREGITALIPDIDMGILEETLFKEPRFTSVSEDSITYKMIYGFGEESILDCPVTEIAAGKARLETLVRTAYASDPELKYWNVEDAF